MAKALLFPSYMGGGFGHIGRCLALAIELKRQNWQTAFVMTGPHLTHVEKQGYRVFKLKRPFQPRPEAENPPAFTIFSDMNYQIVRDGLFHPLIIRACVAEQLRIINRYQPDVLIADTWPLAGILSHLSGIPLVQITKSIAHPAQPGLIWWQAVPQGLVPPDTPPLFNPLLKKWKLPPIEKAEDLLTGDIHLLPSIPQLDPLPPDTADIHYVGPLIRPATDTLPDWFDNFVNSQPLVYVTLGGGAGPVGGVKFYRLLIEAFTDIPVRVLVSTGTKVSPQSLPTPPPNIRLEAWVPGPAIINQSALVVFHGGYGTAMETALAGVPSLIIPFHSEQESNARRLEAAGVARVLLPGRGEPEQKWHKWPGGKFSLLIQPQSGLTSAQLQTEVLAMLAKPNYTANAKRLQAQFAGYGGPTEAVAQIDALLGQSLSSRQKGLNRVSWLERFLLKV